MIQRLQVLLHTVRANRVRQLIEVGHAIRCGISRDDVVVLVDDVVDDASGAQHSAPFLADDGRRYVLDTATKLACSSFTRARKTLTHPSSDLDLLMATLTLNRQASGSLHNGSHFLSVTS